MSRADVAVMGAGVFGLATAFACARRGARVRVLDPRGIGTGASGGPVGALAPHAPESWNAAKAFQFESLAMAEGWWAAVAAAGGGDPGFARTGRVQPLADAAAVARAEARAAAAVAQWGAAWAWQVRPVADVPGLSVESPSGLVVHDTLSGRLDPRRALAALAAAVAALGGAVERGDTPPPADAVVWATGWEGLAALGIGGAEKGQALRLAFDARSAPVVTAPGLYIVPHADGTVGVGSTAERTFDHAAPDDLLAEALSRAVATCPALAGAPVLERWAGLRPRAATRLAILGAWPGRPGRFLANGGFKTGFGLAPLAAERLADLILEGRSDIPEVFTPHGPS
jgi:glycine oxidase